MGKGEAAEKSGTERMVIRLKGRREERKDEDEKETDCRLHVVSSMNFWRRDAQTTRFWNAKSCPGVLKTVIFAARSLLVF